MRWPADMAMSWCSIRKKIEAKHADKWRQVKLPQPLLQVTCRVAASYGDGCLEYAVKRSVRRDGGAAHLSSSDGPLFHPIPHC